MSVSRQSAHRWQVKPSGRLRLPLLSTKPSVTFTAEDRYHLLASTKLYCLVTRVLTTWTDLVVTWNVLNAILHVIQMCRLDFCYNMIWLLLVANKMHYFVTTNNLYAMQWLSHLRKNHTRTHKLSSIATKSVIVNCTNVTVKSLWSNSHCRKVLSLISSTVRMM